MKIVSDVQSPKTKIKPLKALKKADLAQKAVESPLIYPQGKENADLNITSVDPKVLIEKNQLLDSQESFDFSVLKGTVVGAGLGIGASAALSSFSAAVGSVAGAVASYAGAVVFSVMAAKGTIDLGWGIGLAAASVIGVPTLVGALVLGTAGLIVNAGFPLIGALIGAGMGKFSKSLDEPLTD